MSKLIAFTFTVTLLAAPTFAQRSPLHLTARSCDGQLTKHELRARPGDALTISLRNVGSKAELALAVVFPAPGASLDPNQIFPLATMSLRQGEEYHVDIVAPDIGQSSGADVRAYRLPPDVQGLRFELLAGGFDAYGRAIQSNRVAVKLAP